MAAGWGVCLADKVALVTGATSGLGRAMALGFADAGADVVVVGRKQDACEQVAAEVAQRGRAVLAYACHVGDWDALKRLADVAYERFGRVDVLVNSAGIAPRYSSLVDIDEALYDKVLDVNLKGPFRLSALIGDRMAAGAGGSIVQISSYAVRRPTMDVAVYAAAKAGLHALTAALADAYGPKVRVNCIQCGVFHTRATAAWSRSEAFKAQADRDTALRRAAEPDEIVGTALYLAGDASSFTTGAVIRVDGGAP